MAFVKRPLLSFHVLHTILGVMPEGRRKECHPAFKNLIKKKLSFTVFPSFRARQGRLCLSGPRFLGGNPITPLTAAARQNLSAAFSFGTL
jgi:hypothetical protein